MRLQDFLNLPSEHAISFEDGQQLHKDIALNGSAGLSNEQSDRLQTYLEICLLHQTVESDRINVLEAICKDLQSRDNEKLVK